MLFDITGDNVSTAQHQRLELKIKELETKLELEKTTRGRMETQITRLKEAIEKLNHECDSLRVKVNTYIFLFGIAKYILYLRYFSTKSLPVL